MPEISLTQFVDFVIRAGSPKLTAVRQIMNTTYSPASDFWKAARENISAFHGGKAKLGEFKDYVHSSRQARYDAALSGYKRFLKKAKGDDPFVPPNNKWSSSGLIVRVNPEVGIRIGGKRHVIKLYFKDEEPTKHRLNAVLELMRLSLRKGSFEDVVVAVLDVTNAKLITAQKEDPGFEVLLNAEAQSFMSIWNALLKEKEQLGSPF
jgi:hypothetical protein